MLTTSRLTWETFRCCSGGASEGGFQNLGVRWCALVGKKRKLPASILHPESPTKWGEWKDFHYHGKALPDKNLWNEETPTASKAGKRPDRDTPPSLQSSFVQRRRLRRSARLAQGLAEKSSTSESV